MSGLREEDEIIIKLKAERGRLRRRMIQYQLVPCLPEEILLNILSRLPVDAVLESRLVCKAWSNLPLLPHHNNYFADMHLRHCQQQQQQQQHHHHHDHHNHSTNYSAAATNKICFVFLGCSRQTPICYVDFDKEDVVDEPSFRQKQLVTRTNLPLPPHSGSMVGSCNGLICISLLYRKKAQSFVEDPVYICNPITREIINLPRCVVTERDDYNDVRIVHGFGYHPFTNEYKVVRIYYCGIGVRQQQPVLGRVQVYTLGSGSGWRDVGEITYLCRHSYRSVPVLLDGTLHWLTEEDKIVAFDLVDEEFRLLPTPPFSSHNWCESSRLWLLEGGLCLVHQVSYFSADIWLLKKNDLKETWSWSKEFSVGVPFVNMNEHYQPLAITKEDGISFLYNNKTIVHYDPKTATSKNLWNLDTVVPLDVIWSHFHSFVSSKALGENSLIEIEESAPKAIGEDAKIIGSADELDDETKSTKGSISIEKKRSIKRKRSVKRKRSMHQLRS